MNVRAYTDELTAYRMASRQSIPAATVHYAPRLGCDCVDVWLVVPNETTVAELAEYLRRCRAWREAVDAPSHPDDANPHGIVRPSLRGVG